MSWDNISKSLGTVIDERLSSPLISTFAISWSIINYKFFVLLLSRTPAVETFAQIKTHVFPDAWAYAFNGVIYPAVATAVYLFALPKPSRWVFEKWRANQKLTDDIRKRYDDMQPLTLEESRSLRAELGKLRSANDQLTKERDQYSEDAKSAWGAQRVAELERDQNKTHLSEHEQRLNSVQQQLESVERELDEKNAKLEQEKRGVEKLRSLVNAQARKSSVIPEIQQLRVLEVLRNQSLIDDNFSIAMLIVLRTLSQKALSISQVVGLVRPVVPPEAIHNSLQLLTDQGYAIREGASVIGSEGYYRATERGMSVTKAVNELFEWIVGGSS